MFIMAEAGENYYKMKTKILMVLGAVIIALAGCQAQQKQNGSFTNLSASEFKDQIQKVEGIVLDVRTPDEIAQGKIGDATEINFYEDDFIQKASKLPKDQPIYVYCAAGGRSSKAANMLLEQGFTKVYNLDWGIGSWNQNGFELKK